MTLTDANIKNYRPDIALIALGIVAVLFSLIASLVSGEGTWFARSGAVMVLSAAVLEFRQLHFGQLILLAAALGNRALGLPTGDQGARVKKYRTRLQWSALVLAIFGTLIWAYGDLPFPK